jgi:ABC-type nickel/cobalt efflux system permease component RcnA
MNTTILATAAGIGLLHTAIGVDHYIPFVAMSKANKWNLAKTIVIVLVCGLGHVLSSVVLGLFGIWFGSQVTSLVGIEDMRGEIAAWFLIAFGLVYMLWGLRNAVKNKPHSHKLDDGSEVWHDHHAAAHATETHGDAGDGDHAGRHGTSRSFWPLFVLFVLGPCEPLIPLLMYPAARDGMLPVVATAAVFSVCTLAAMLACTLVVLFGVNMIPVKRMERYAHALAGFAVLACGLSVQFLGI